MRPALTAAVAVAAASWRSARRRPGLASAALVAATLGLTVAWAAVRLRALTAAAPVPPSCAVQVRVDDAGIDEALWRRLDAIGGVRAVLPRCHARGTVAGSATVAEVVALDFVREAWAAGLGAEGAAVLGSDDACVVDASDAERLGVGVGDWLVVDGARTAGRRLHVAAVVGGLRAGIGGDPDADVVAFVPLAVGAAPAECLVYRLLLEPETDFATVVAGVRSLLPGAEVSLERPSLPARARAAQAVAVPLLSLLLLLAGLAVASGACALHLRAGAATVATLRDLGAPRWLRAGAWTAPLLVVLVPAAALAATLTPPLTAVLAGDFARSTALSPAALPAAVVADWLHRFQPAWWSGPSLAAGAAVLALAATRRWHGRGRRVWSASAGAVMLAFVVVSARLRWSDAMPMLRPVGAVAAIAAALLLGPLAVAAAVRGGRGRAALWMRALLPADDRAVAWCQAATVVALSVPATLVVVRASVAAALPAAGALVDAAFAFEPAMTWAALAFALLAAASATAQALAARRRSLDTLAQLGMSPRSRRRRLVLGCAVRGAACGLVAAALGVVVGSAWACATLAGRLQLPVPLRVPVAALAACIAAAAAISAMAAWLGDVAARRAAEQARPRTGAATGP